MSGIAILLPLSSAVAPRTQASRRTPVEAIEHMLRRRNCNRKQAARHAGVSYKTLLQSIRCYRLGPG
ncbi:MAG: hypothetical protein JRG80_13460 [Deltaproteobacteria bacterium]|nr:hypothetical protein [Deltaproteobacteria bacterium]MBW2400264.1 hypothetical protein [Deltaproteobacteria bacterium]MBW2666655.1 hypothetical protein [Deltaproteobacteria bacterium]